MLRRVRGGLSPAPPVYCLLYPAYLMPYLVSTTFRTARA
jgi:hypothetical protein